MSLDHLPPSIEKGIRQFADKGRISRDEALVRLLKTALSVEQKDPNLGLGHRRGRRKPDLEVARNQPIIGIFSNDPAFDRTMDAIIAGRANDALERPDRSW